MRLPPSVRDWTSRPIRNIPVRVRAGPNRGRKWSLAVSGRGTISGRYEAERFLALTRLVRPDDVVWDVGAHYGYATLIAARLAGPRGQVISLEPSSSNRSYLTRHLDWNGETEVRVLPYAVSDSDRMDAFGGRGGSVAFRLGEAGETVEVRSMTSLLASGVPFPTFMKVDVEGAEESVLMGARIALQQRRDSDGLPTMFVSVHSERMLESCVAFLKVFDYRILGSRGIATFQKEGGAWRGDPDLLAVPPHRHGEISEMQTIPWFTPRTEL